MEKINTAYFKILIPLLLIFLSIAGLIFFTKATNKFAKEYLQGNAEFLSLRNKINSFYQQEANLEKYQENISTISNAFLPSDEIVSFLTELESFGPKQNVAIEIKSVSSPTKEKPYFIFQLGIKGSFSNFLKFLFALEDTPFGKYRLIEIKEISIKRVISGNAQQSSVDSELEVYVYSK